MEKQALREYLERIKQLESDIYTMDRTIATLQVSTKSLPEKRYFAPPVKHLPEEPKREDFDNPGVKNQKVSTGIAAGAGLLLLGPIGGIAGYALSKAGKPSKRDIDKAYENALLEYQKAVNESEREYQKEMEQYKRDVLAEDNRYQHLMVNTQQFNNGIQRQIECVRRNKADSEYVLRKLYDLGIIYVKYRSFIPVCMFCEYLDSGRRTELEGTNGMYDLYEAELLGKQIVGGLEAVNDELGRISHQMGYISNQLTGIQRNQILLYEEVAKGNSIAQQIREETQYSLERLKDSVNDRLDSIGQSAKMTEFHAAAAARRADALASIAEFEHHEKMSDRFFTV